MESEILEIVEDLKKNNRNFAYFCKFTDDQRITGEETLITGTDVIEASDTSIFSKIQKKHPSFFRSHL